MTRARLLNAIFFALMGGAAMVALLMVFTEIGDTTTDTAASIGLAALAALVNTFIPAAEPVGTSGGES